ncbi:hypothetical protein MTO96_045816 [Rhipicephalus appendiculatus]
MGPDAQVDIATASRYRALLKEDDSTAPMESRPPPMVPCGYFSVIGDAAFVGTGSRPPQRSNGATGEQRHREGPLSEESMRTMLWFTLIFAAMVLTGGVFITSLAYSRKVAHAGDKLLGVLMILLGVIVAVAAAAASSLFRPGRQGRSPPV